MTTPRAWPLNELLADWCGRALPKSVVTGLSQDSRRIRPGDAFVALPGSREHGLSHAADAVARGAVAILADGDAPADMDMDDAVALGVPVCRIADLPAKLGAIAARFYGQPAQRMTVIGVTGTDGKSSVSHFLAQALDQDGARAGIVGTLGNGLVGALSPSGYTTPDAIGVQAALADMAAAGARWAVMEASSHGLVQGRLNAVGFNQAILTQLSRDHLDYHGSLEAYAAAKRRLFEVPGLEYAILNLDDAFGRTLANGDIAARHCIGYSLAPVRPTGEHVVWASDLRMRGDGFDLDVQTPWGGCMIESALLGRFNAANLMAVLASLLALGVPLPDATDRLRAVRPVPGRMERFGRAGGPLAVVDYAHTPAALEAVLGSLREHGAERLYCVFGAGGDRDRGKRPLMGEVVERLSDQVIVTDDNPRSEDPARIVEDILSGFKDRGKVRVIHDRAVAVRQALEAARPGDVVLIAGKGHETVQIAANGSQHFSDRETVAAWFGAAEVAL
ncbi:UDP-N-acetylmuramoyl-L-alanyl-D-glutamate--2,6-diaminopimelate ligase [Acidihalobacter prosperus]|uniref:UDP-N-acetylmuramoyl-L-alanyl-D-glutamate--2,6-diaminopimelate ligase n=1 Tax=Acidihalobacter prosperus TaxID=160660 RepID=A0A1A6C3E2_9GAMM|nr:UDP-N-acetylmuramoyl-L-alanyl-D-glutamate--2,6-diaminopimelate ligase [Acidihalobacter prosperus]OBS09078.1 UDP-N-acetylmuramoyl-L-alanyl-D-glutamate--2, 6-diaminopimelate ligase [Acidihalobacter prosperus]